MNGSDGEPEQLRGDHRRNVRSYVGRGDRELVHVGTAPDANRTSITVGSLVSCD
jgi:hypothetical protein